VPVRPAGPARSLARWPFERRGVWQSCGTRRYVGRPVDIDAGELVSLQPAEVDDVLDREVVTSGVLTF
jgi:hypothetical protein